MPTVQVLSSYPDFGLLEKRGQDVVWSIAVIKFTVSIAFKFFGACYSGIDGLTCTDDCMCCNGQGVLVPLTCNVLKPNDKIWLS